MAKTHGTTDLALPLALTLRLKEMGYLRVAGPQAPLFRHPKRPNLFVSATPSNIPGDTDVVTARWHGHPVTRISVDRLCDILEDQIAESL